MDFVDEEDVAGAQVGEDGSQVAGAFNGRAGGGADVHVHFLGDDVRQGGFAQTGGAVEEDVVYGFLA